MGEFLLGGVLFLHCNFKCWYFYFRWEIFVNGFFCGVYKFTENSRGLLLFSHIWIKDPAGAGACILFISEPDNIYS